MLVNQAVRYQEDARAHNLAARALSAVTVNLYMHGVMSVEGVYGQRRLDDQVTMHCHPLFMSQCSFDLLASVSHQSRVLADDGTVLY